MWTPVGAGAGVTVHLSLGPVTLGQPPPELTPTRAPEPLTPPYLTGPGRLRLVESGLQPLEPPPLAVLKDHSMQDILGVARPSKARSSLQFPCRPASGGFCPGPCSPLLTPCSRTDQAGPAHSPGGGTTHLPLASITYSLSSQPSQCCSLMLQHSSLPAHPLHGSPSMSQARGSGSPPSPRPGSVSLIYGHRAWCSSQPIPCEVAIYLHCLRLDAGPVL